jgi:hypothetical protein
MAAVLVPLLLPVISEVAAGISTFGWHVFVGTRTDSSTAMGITNAAQGENTGFTLQIGNKVFSNQKPFPFNALP